MCNTYSLLLLVHVAGLGQLNVARSQFSGGGELYSVFGAGDHDRVPNLGQVAAYTSKLPRWHFHNTAVLLFLRGGLA